MDELQKEYTLLFNGITDTIRQLEKTTRKLRLLQERAEELYMTQESHNATGQNDGEIVVLGLGKLDLDDAEVGQE